MIAALISLMLALSPSSYLQPASFFMNITGKVVTTSDQTILRESYPDGRILAVLPKGTTLKVLGMAGDGNGEWLQVQVRRSDLPRNAGAAPAPTFTFPNDSDVLGGFVPPDSTTFGAEIQKSGRLPDYSDS